MPNEEVEFTPGPASNAIISLSQAILAPLDAVLKGQIHAARSFLNFVLQMGYPHYPVDESGNPIPKENLTAEEQKKYDTLYNLEFYHETATDNQSRRQKVSIPALALVPVAPLAVESAEFTFDIAVSHIYRHRQIQRSEGKALGMEGEAAKKKDPKKEQATKATPNQKPEEEAFGPHYRPWFLVENPISIRGAIAPKASAPKGASTEAAQEDSEQAKIHIEIKVGTLKMPAALDKLLTALTQTSHVTDVPPSSTQTAQDTNQPNP